MKPDPNSDLGIMRAIFFTLLVTLACMFAVFSCTVLHD